ncbi:MAG: hypothetical protein LLG20_14885 [Acidobacteriales bacterium]|nr:hypothetical protein [Terriglobales bacterium]
MNIIQAEYTHPYDGYRMLCGSAMAEEQVYRKVQGKLRNTWYIPVNTETPGEGIQLDTHDPRSEGYAGRTLSFRLEDGTVDQVKGPWHSNSSALFEDTGVDVRDTFRTFVVIGLQREYRNTKDAYAPPTIIDVLYLDPPEGQIGSFNREKAIAKKLFGEYAELETLYYYSQSRGGTSSGPINRKDCAGVAI